MGRDTFEEFIADLEITHEKFAVSEPIRDEHRTSELSIPAYGC